MDRERRFWEREARRYDASMRILGGPIPRAVECTADAVRGAARVLEVAAGTGLFTPAIAAVAAEVVATDYAEAMVAKLAVRVSGLPNVIVQQADLCSLPVEPESFDAVVAANVLHLVPDLDSALASLRRALRKGGKLIAPTYAHDQTRITRTLSRIASRFGFPSHRRFSDRTLVDAIERAGFRVERTELIAGLFPIAFVEAVAHERGRPS